jgi:hypothetical protein
MIVDKYLREKEKEFTAVLWTLRMFSIKLIEKPYSLNRKERNE